MEMDALYREVILDHHRHPHGGEPLPDPETEAAGKNPSCGDEVTLQLRWDGDRIADVAVLTEGCAISRASGSILADLVRGRTREQARRLAEAFRRVMHEPDGELPDDLEPGDLEVLTGVRQFPARVKCALLPWITLLEALLAAEQDRAPAAVSTEETTDGEADRG